MSRLEVRDSAAISVKESINLDSFINFEVIKNKQGRVLFRFVWFNLDPRVLEQVLQARDNRKRLYLSRNLLAQLRYLALSDGENRDWKNHCQSGLTFCSYYHPQGRLKQKSKNLVMRSVISLDGEVLHQVRRDCLENPQQCIEITTAHYWLVNQMLIQLHLKTRIKFWLSCFSWVLALLVVTVIVISYGAKLATINPLIILVVLVVGLWGLQIIIKYLLRLVLPLLRLWAWRQVLSFFLSAQGLKKKIARGILGRFVP
jgi:hypothetical protein